MKTDEEKAAYDIERKQESAVQSKLAAMFSSSKDEITVPKIYVDMTDDIKAAMVLDELMFWTLPKRGTGKTSLRVRKNGVLWLAVRRSDWWDRKRLSERQADGAIAKLIELNLIEKDIFLFDGKPTVHIHIKTGNFVRMYGEKLSSLEDNEDQDFSKDIADLYEMMGFPNETVNSILPNGEMLNLPNGEIINSLQQPPNTPYGQKKSNLANEELESLVDLEQSDIAWTIAAGKPVTQKLADRQAEVYKFEEMICKELARLPYNFEGDKTQEQDGFRKFLKAQRKLGCELEVFVNWWMSDEWRVANPPWNLTTIKTKWLQAFPKTNKPDVDTDSNGIPLSY